MYPESNSEDTVVGNYLLERKEIGGRGLFFPAGRNLPGVKMLFLEFKEKRDSINIDRIGLLIFSFSILFRK